MLLHKVFSGPWEGDEMLKLHSFSLNVSYSLQV